MVSGISKDPSAALHSGRLEINMTQLDEVELSEFVRSGVLYSMRFRNATRAKKVADLSRTFLEHSSFPQEKRKRRKNIEKFKTS